MFGTDAGDGTDPLVKSFIEEMTPYCADIRRGIGCLFAPTRDAGMVTTARHGLTTVSTSTVLLDGAGVQHLAELAILLEDAFAAADRGEMPKRMRAPLLALVDDFEAQLRGLDLFIAGTGDSRGRDRVERGRRLLAQLRRSPRRSVPAPAEGLDLDDLLPTLTNGPATPGAEATPTGLTLLAPEAVAPIEWGEKETLAWQKGAWDERGAKYGNTDILFIDDEE